MNLGDVTIKQLSQLADDLHTKAPASYGTSMLHDQPGGLFNVPGLEAEVISTHVHPRGIGNVLPALPSDTDDPRYAFILGWQKATGSQPNAPCDDAPKNFMKGGNLTAQFGRLTGQTNTIEVDQVLHRARGSSSNLRLMNAMMGMDTLATGNFPANPLDTVISAEMLGVGIGFERDLASMTWNGDISNNTAQGGYKEFPGLASQIATGHVDADTNTAMPAADSTVLDFSYNLVDSTARDIVEYMTALEFHLTQIDSGTRLGNVSRAIAMRPELWQYLTMVWPCRYNTNRCTTFVPGNTNPVVINDDGNIQMRDQMRRSKTIEINGNTYPVITDDGIFQSTNVNDGNVPAAHYASDIFFVPLVANGMPVTYWEFIDYRQVRTELAPMGAGSQHIPIWTDGGRFLWTTEFIKWCLNMTAKIEPRIVLRTPHLAGRIDNVMVAPLLHQRDWNPDSPYWYDGGVSTRSTATSYAVWK
jgi:hypothetical protein